MNIVIIGNCGHSIDVVHEILMLDDFKIEAVSYASSDENIDKMLLFLETKNIVPTVYDDYKKMLKELSPNIAIVSPRFDLCSEVCIYCAQRGINVISEKPLSTTLEDFYKLKEVVLDSKICLMGMHFLRFESRFYTANLLIDEGLIGLPRLITAQKSYKLGKRADLYKKRQTYGGTIPWVGIHAIDWISQMSKEKFVGVSALQTVKFNDGNGELETNAVCQYELTNQVFATMSLDYLRPSDAPEYSDDRVRIAGTRGVIEVIGQDIVLINESGRQLIKTCKGISLFQDFVNQIHSKSNPILSTEETLYITEVALKTREAADKHEHIKF